MPEGLINVAAYLPEMARRQPEERAIVWRAGRDAGGRATYAHWTFLELDQETDRTAHGLERIGIRRGTRTVLMVRPSPEFFTLVFALFKVGAVPVLVDPGMGWRRMVACLEAVAAEAFIGIPPAHVLRVVHPGAFRSVKTCITVGRRWFWGGHRLADLRIDPWRPYEMAPTRRDDPAAIIFTTGSTGPPKGVLYLHGIFAAQVRMLRERFEIEPGEVDLPTFPLFGLFDPALGMTAVIPEMDPTRPASVDPEKIIEAIRDQEITNVFGSPALLDRVGRYGAARGVKLPSLKRVVSAGAPVPPRTLERFAGLLRDPTGETPVPQNQPAPRDQRVPLKQPVPQIHTPYGATEALPVTSIGSVEILEETRETSAIGGGTCVGRPLSGMTVRVIRITEGPIETWSDELSLPTGEIGEIVVKGPVVTREYCTDAEATRRAKIRDGAARCADRDGGGVWHRMGDVGRFDEQGRLWFCGRKAHRVMTERGTLYTVPCEAVFNEHPRVYRSALVGVGRPPTQQPVMCVELEPGDSGGDKGSLTRELREAAHENALTRSIETVLYHPSFPVDIRHNAKIFREELAEWATKQLR